MMSLLTDSKAKQLLSTFSGVSRETVASLECYAEELIAWQARINLISPSTLHHLWSRHILDCAQIVEHAPDEAREWVDFGSGAGLPGIIIAILFANQPERHIHLIESNAKKAAFLRHVSTKLLLNTKIHNGRIEEIVPCLPKIDVVTARALAPLDDLLRYSNELLKSGAIALFPKGREVVVELTSASRNWHFSYTLISSITDPDAKIVRVERMTGESVL